MTTEVGEWKLWIQTWLKHPARVNEFDKYMLKEQSYKLGTGRIYSLAVKCGGYLHYLMSVEKS